MNFYHHIVALATFLVSSCCSLHAQITFNTKGPINYSVQEANATKWNGFAHFELSSQLLGTTGLGFNAGAQGQYKLPALPVTLAGRFKYEIIGVGDVVYKGEAYGPSRNLELGALLPILPGRKKDSRVKVITDYSASNTSTYEEYFFADGQKKNDLLARGGLFQFWTKGNFSSTGIAAGLTFRMREHVKVKINGEEGFEREVFTNSQIYADILYAPIITGIRADEGYRIGGRIGYLQASSRGANYYVELEVRPGLVVAATFGLLIGWERLK